MADLSAYRPSESFGGHGGLQGTELADFHKYQRRQAICERREAIAKAKGQCDQPYVVIHLLMSPSPSHFQYGSDSVSDVYYWHTGVLGVDRQKDRQPFICHGRQ